MIKTSHDLLLLGADGTVYTAQHVRKRRSGLASVWLDPIQDSASQSRRSVAAGSSRAARKAGIPQETVATIARPTIVVA